MEIKITKTNYFDAIINFVTEGAATVTIGEDTVELTNEAIVEFCTKQKEALAQKAAKAKESAAKRKTEDALLALVEAALTEEPQVIADIAAKVAESAPDATVSKVQYRLKVLTDNGVATKSDATVTDSEGKKRTIKAYALA